MADTTMKDITLNYDEKLAQLEANRQNELTENKGTFDSMINEAGEMISSAKGDIEDWKNQQSQLQNEQTDFIVEQINQQKEQANKDYIREQSGAYVDWQKQSNQYGANAEQMASSGLSNTGYSESSQVSMYNTYQNRVASARESYNKAVLNYDNNIKEAQLQNSSKLAEIYYTALQQQLELSLQGFQYKNDLVLQQMAQKEAINNRYDDKWQSVLNQMNTENALAEEMRQYNEQMAYKKEQDAKAYDQWLKEYNLSQSQLEEEKRQWDEKMAEEKRQFDLINATNEKNVALLEAGTSNAPTSISIDASSGTTNNSSTSLKSMSSGLKYGVPTTNKTNTSSAKIDANGNSAETQKKSDFYHSNSDQYRYVENEKLAKSGYNVGNVLGSKYAEYGIKNAQNIWKTKSGKYYIWADEDKIYINVTDEFKAYEKKLEKNTSPIDALSHAITLWGNLKK